MCLLWKNYSEIPKQIRLKNVQKFVFFFKGNFICLHLTAWSLKRWRNSELVFLPRDSCPASFMKTQLNIFCIWMINDDGSFFSSAGYRCGQFVMSIHHVCLKTWLRRSCQKHSKELKKLGNEHVSLAFKKQGLFLSVKTENKI